MKNGKRVIKKDFFPSTRLKKNYISHPRFSSDQIFARLTFLYIKTKAQNNELDVEYY